MCGIAGIVSAKGFDGQNRLNLMIDSLHHRGPDERGICYFSKCALGHARLSIIDLSSGQQPMFDVTKTIGLVFNGEIYGYKEIKKEFKDYKFQNNSDTELIIALYKKYETDMLTHLPGIFSFGLWDESNQQLFCARDRFGEKPFYYAFGPNGEFIFASEIKSIIASGLIKPILNLEAVSHFLKKLYVHPYQSIYKNIFSLPPAHSILYKDGKIKTEKYWNLPEVNHKISYEDAVYEFSSLLKQSISRQLIADVPVGAFLSGGLDSSTIVALASEINPNIKVFSFGFGEDIDEVKYARLTAKKYNLDFIELQARQFDLVNLFEEMQTVYDEPLADFSNIPTYLIAKCTQEHTKVVLTGDGGDELLGGYGWYQRILKMQNIRSNNARKMLLTMYSKMYFLIRSFNLHNLHYRISPQLKNFMTSDNVIGMHDNSITYFNEFEISDLLAKPIFFKKPSLDIIYTNTPTDAMNMDLLDYMPGDILVKIDRASMANSLELRAPFLDVDLAEFCISLPHTMKVSAKDTKLLLRSSFENLWIDEIKHLPKQGFGAPVKSWLQTDEMKKLKQFYINNPSLRIYSILDKNLVRKYIMSDNNKSWIMMTLASWMEKHDFVLG